MTNNWLSRTLFSSAMLAGACYMGPAAADDAGVSAANEGVPTRDGRAAAWEALSPEEQAARLEERRTQRSALSDEERAALRERREERRGSMTPEQREAALERRRVRLEAMSPGQREALRERRRTAANQGARGGQRDTR